MPIHQQNRVRKRILIAGCGGGERGGILQQRIFLTIANRKREKNAFFER